MTTPPGDPIPERGPVLHRVTATRTPALAAGAVTVVLIGLVGSSLLGTPASSPASAPSVVISVPTPTATTPTSPPPVMYEAGQLLRATSAMSLADWTIRVGQSMYVVARGQDGSDDVYTIQHWGDLEHGLRPDTVIGTIPTEVVHKSAEPYTAACPTDVAAVEDIAALHPFERLVCFGSEELAFGPVQREEYHVGTGDPSWLAGEAGLDFFTAIPYRPATGVDVPKEGWLRVAGHFDDPSCDGDLRCRERFVVTNVAGIEPPESELRGSWKRMAEAPIEGRSSYVAVEIDRGTFIWGGEPLGSSAIGAIYDAARDRWTPTAPAPDDGRLEVASAWSGQEVLVWGGYRGLTKLGDGLAYDPSEDRWRAIPTAPIKPGFAEGAWTGREFLVVSSEAEAAAWDPAIQRWRRLSDAPLPPGAMESVWTGTEFLVLGIGDGTTEPVIGAALDPATGRWRPIADVPYDGLILGIPARWTGVEMVFVGHAYDPRADRWRALRAANCSPKAVSYGVWSGRWLISQVAAYDATRDRCLTLPRSPDRPGFDGMQTHEFHTPFWADGRLVVWSGGTGADTFDPPPPDGIVFTPSE